jgi:hypothetical protein
MLPASSVVEGVRCLLRKTSRIERLFCFDLPYCLSQLVANMHSTLFSVLQLLLLTLSLAASIPNVVLPRQGSGTLKYGMCGDYLETLCLRISTNGVS